MSAERKRLTADQVAIDSEEPFALRQQVSERLAAHRSRRSRTTDSAEEESLRPNKSRIAAAVAERYANSKSYHAYLAEEAERAVREAEEAARQAEAAAEIAARNAEALAQVQYNLLAELDQADQAEIPQTPFVAGPAAVSPRHPRMSHVEEPTPSLDFDPPAPVVPSFTVRLAEDLRVPAPDTVASSYRNQRMTAAASETPIADSELDEEIAFRQSPVFDPVEPTVEIPGNLIEFPRQLVASRRARPRLAEGPLREESEAHSDPSQLRIFEVESEQISSEPAAEAAAPEWSSILLDAYPRSGPATHRKEYATAASPEQTATPDPYAAQHLQLSPETEHLYSSPLAVAPISLRLMSAIVDGCIILAGFLAFAAVSVLTMSHFEPGAVHMPLPIVALSSIGTIVLLGLLYQLLFFTYSDATPGMRYARIGLCTFSDSNPSRAAMRRRIFAVALATASLGLGVLWAFLDDERLGWHDRISRMYQRSY